MATAVPPPVCPDSWKTPGFGSDVCSLLKQLLMVSEKLFTFMSWMFTPTTSPCKLSVDFVAQFASTLQPIGSVVWAPTDLGLDPLEWIKADGISRSKTEYPELYIVYAEKFGTDPDSSKFKIPNMNGRVTLGEGIRTANNPITPDPLDPDTMPGIIAYTAGGIGGLDEVALVPTEMAYGDHAHGVSGLGANQSPAKSGVDADVGGVPWYPPVACKDFNGQLQDIFKKPLEQSPGWNRIDQFTTEAIRNLDTGNPGEAHTNMPPFVVGIYYIRASHRIASGTVPI